MVTVANLNQPAPPLNDIVVELSVPISFGVSVISAESALPFTLRAEGIYAVMSTAHAQVSPKSPVPHVAE